MHCHVSLHGDSDRHVDGGRHCDDHAGEEDVGKEQDVDVGGQVEALPEGLQDGSDQIETVKTAQRDQ